MYDYLIVGSGLFGATFCQQAVAAGKHCLVVEKRSHIGGNCHTEKKHSIDVHRYGPHIFHTGNEMVWRYAQRFASFNHFINSPLANYKGTLYNLPFNMNTFNKLWGVVTPQQAKDKIASQTEKYAATHPENLEEQALRLVGPDVYERLIKGYTEKQWGRPCHELPAAIIKRLPVRFIYDNNYFNDRYQGIPIGGYTAMIEKMLHGATVTLNTDYLANKEALDKKATTIIYTGAIDEYYDYCYGPLEYRHIYFDTETLNTPNFQGNAVINYTDKDTPYTRVIEHKHFDFGDHPQTVVSREYSKAWRRGMAPYYPVQTGANMALYNRYKTLAETEENTHFGGRLASYQYYDMDQVIEKALALHRQLADEN